MCRSYCVSVESKYKTEERKYDGFNQLTEVKGAANVRYGYRPDGLRLSKDAGNEHTDYIWNGSQIMAEVKNGAVERTRVYSYGLRRTKSTVWGQPESYYVYNAHGDVVQLTGPVGYENYDPDADNYVSKNLLKTYEYDAFGDEMGKEESDTNPFRYCGEYYDAETESIYLRARNYDPGTGRFTSEDPARDGLNWYAYCENNPVMFYDPSGKAYSGNKYVETIAEALKSGYATSIRSLWKGNEIGDWAREYAIKYAEIRGFRTSNGEIKTWDNEADALRHFSWNAKMTREIGIRDAEIIAFNHENVTWETEDCKDGFVAKLTFSSLMDLHNNKMGRLYATQYANLSYATLFLKANSENNVIISLEQVKEKYKLDDTQIFIDNNTKYINLYYSNHILEPPRIINKDEYEKLKK